MPRSYSSSDIVNMIEARRETVNWDYKAQIGFNNKPRDLAGILRMIKHIAAFANKNGGVLIFGVDPSYNLIGLQEDDLKTDISQFTDIVSQYIEPPPCLEFWTTEVKGYMIGVLEIQSVHNKPCIMKKNGEYRKEGEKDTKSVFLVGDIFIRRGGQSAKITYSELREIITNEMIELKDKLLDGINKVIALPISFLENVNWKNVQITDSPSAIPVRITHDEEAAPIRELVTIEPAVSPDQKSILLAKYRKTFLDQGSIFSLYASREVLDYGNDDELAVELFCEAVKVATFGLAWFFRIDKRNQMRLLIDLFDKSNHNCRLHLIKIAFLFGGDVWSQITQKINSMTKYSLLKRIIGKFDYSELAIDRIEEIFPSNKSVRYDINNIPYYFTRHGNSLENFDIIITTIADELSSNPKHQRNRDALFLAEVARFYDNFI